MREATDTIFEIILSGGMAELQEWLGRTPEAVRERDATGGTPLHYAARLGRTAMVIALLASGGEADARDAIGRTPLFHAIKNERLRAAEALMEAGADISMAPLLDWAISSRSVEMIAFLILRGADAAEAATQLLDLEEAAQLAVLQSDGEHDHPLEETVRLLRFLDGRPDLNEWEGHPLSYEAAYKGWLNVVKLFASCGGDVNTGYDNDESLLDVAAQEGHSPITRFLLGQSALFGERKSGGGTTLHLAAASGRAEIVKQLLSFGADVHAQDWARSTPLHWAAKIGHADVVAILISHGARCDVVDGEGKTPVQRARERGCLLDATSGLSKSILVASEHGRASDVRALLEADPELVNAGYPGSQTAMHLAISSGNFDLIKTLLEYEAPVNAPDSLFRRPLHVAAAAKWNTYWPRHQDTHRVFSLLTDSGADIASGDHQQRTPLHVAAFYGIIANAECLISLGADVNTADEKGRTPLREAVEEGHIKMIRLLLSHGGTVNQIDKAGDAPLHIAVSFGDVATVQCLLENGCDVNLRDGKKNTCIHRCAMVKSPTPGEWDSSSSRPELLVSRLQIAQHLWSRGAELDAEGQSGRRPLHWACAGGYVPMVEWLIAVGVDVNARTYKARTPLHVAVKGYSHRAAVVGRLLKAGAVPDTADADGVTPLKIAIELQETRIIRMLEDARRKADITGQV